jgi:hypothetical protein
VCVGLFPANGCARDGDRDGSEGSSAAAGCGDYNAELVDENAIVEQYNSYDTHWQFYSFLVPAILGWFLMCNQLTVLYITQRAFGRLFQAKGCNCANELPEFMRRLDAELEMTHFLHTMPMFEGCGREFLDSVMANLVPRTCGVGEVVCASGTTADSMLFICKGYTDVRSADGQELGTLGPGDHFGDGALLSDELRLSERFPFNTGYLPLTYRGNPG